jgi:probable HAF family extracellular repeat protein
MSKTGRIMGWVAVAVAVLTVQAAGATWYTITDLGDLQGGDNDSHANAINDNGQVVGYSDTAPNQRFGDDGFHAFLWDPNAPSAGMRDIGVSVGTQRVSYAYGINNSGTVVGLWCPNWFRGFKWSSLSGATDLGTDGFGPYSAATAINDDGFIVQQDWNFSGPPSRVYLHSPSGACTDIGTGSGVAHPLAGAINNAEQIVGGNYGLGAGDPGNAYRWDATTEAMTIINPLQGFTRAYANGINETGTVVGVCDNADGSGKPFIWTPEGGIVDLGVLNPVIPHPYGTALGINDAAAVVGGSHVAANVEHAFCWTPDAGLSDLNDCLVDSTDWQYLRLAFDVNNHGQIVGEGVLANGDTHAFLLNPVPEPGTLSLLALGGLALMQRRK